MKKSVKLYSIIIMCSLCLLLSSCGKSEGEKPTVKAGDMQEDITANSKIVEGKTEDGIIYQYNTQTATLTVSGEIIRGAYPDDYTKEIHGEPEARPWDKWRDDAKEIVLEKGVENVTNMAFTGFRNVQKIVFPDTLKKIGMYAFYDSTREIRKLELPDSVEEIGWCAFAQTSCYKGLEEIRLPQKLRNIGELAFASQSLTSVVIPENVESIEKQAFEGCVCLETVTVKSKKIKKAGGDIFLHTNDELAIYVPKELEKKYRRMLGGTDGQVYPMKDK